MVTRIIWALAIFGFFISNIPHIAEFTPFFTYLACFLGIGVPIAIIGNPICEHYYKVWKIRKLLESIIEENRRTMEAIRKVNEHRAKYHNS